MNCEHCQCKDCKLAHEADKGYSHCWGCFNCSDGSNKTYFCSMKENYESTKTQKFDFIANLAT